MHALKNQHGASLLEVMVALLVISLGLLGMAGLQASTAKYRVNVQSLGAVSRLMSELAERVRINADAAGPGFDPRLGDSASLYVLDSTWAAQALVPLDAGKNCEKTACTSAERARFDMTVWRQHVRDWLPQGAAIVQGDRKAGIEVTLMWMDKEQLSEARSPQTAEIDRQLRSAPVCDMGAGGTMVYSCCPAVAQVPVGVRCWRMSFLP